MNKSEYKELLGLARPIRNALVRSNLTTKKKILQCLLNGELDKNTRMLGKKRLSGLLIWLGIDKIEDRTTTTRYVYFSSCSTPSSSPLPSPSKIQSFIPKAKYPTPKKTPKAVPKSQMGETEKLLRARWKLQDA